MVNKQKKIPMPGGEVFILLKNSLVLKKNQFKYNVHKYVPI